MMTINNENVFIEREASKADEEKFSDDDSDIYYFSIEERNNILFERISILCANIMKA